MTQQQKDNWIAALESGQYKQGRHRLFRANLNEYCSLGVFCHVNDIELTDRTQVDVHEVLNGFIDPDDQDILMLLNDRQGKTFPQIAEYVKENIKAS